MVSVTRRRRENHCFSVKKKGFVTSIIEDVVRQRMKIKKKMKELPASDEKTDLYNRQYALKIIANATYGYYAYAGSRWYSRICAKSIAAWGRHYIRKVIDLAEKEGFRVIYGDTDSLFLADCTRKRANEFLETMNRKLPSTMNLEFDGIYEAGIFVAAAPFAIN